MHIEGKEIGDWIAIDYGYVIVHIFIPDMRETYAIEQIWQAGKVVDVEFSIRPGVVEDEGFF